MTLLLRVWAVLCLAAVLVTSAAAQGTPTPDGLQPIPALTSHVIDTTSTLSAADRQALDAKLTAFEQQRGAQVVVLMVASTQPEDITSFAQRVGDFWKIGRQNIGDGLLLVVAKDDRKVRIATTAAAEAATARAVAATKTTPASEAAQTAEAPAQATASTEGPEAGHQRKPQPDDPGHASTQQATGEQPRQAAHRAARGQRAHFAPQHTGQHPSANGHGKKQKHRHVCPAEAKGAGPRAAWALRCRQRFAADAGQQLVGRRVQPARKVALFEAGRQRGVNDLAGDRKSVV